MKHIKQLEDINEAQVDRIKMPMGFAYKGDAIFGNDKFWMVYVFQSPDGKRRYKSISSEAQTMQNFINIIKGGTEANEIAGIFKEQKDAQALYDLLKYDKER